MGLVGCATGGPPACTPGATQSCACGGGATGVQTCNGVGTGYGACGMCSGTPMDGGRPPLCTPNETRVCACPRGVMGTQSCNSAGSGYSSCECPPDPRCGDGRCDMTETCSSCAGDCGMCSARCGDGTCNGTENCMSCAGDCGMCSMPRCGDGTCNGSETCTSCSDDCGACPPRCGDGMCNGDETCASCMTDCADRCESMCTPCASSADCPAGSLCGVRRCDGAKGCYASETAGCSLIGGVRCPATSAYNICVGTTECGPYANCQRFGDGRATCVRRCAANGDCPEPPTGSTTQATCDPMLRVCYLRCTGPGQCPFGLSCFRFGDGTYGFCS